MEAMFDIFTKSRVELGVGTPGLPPFRPQRLDDAWRVYRAIDRALKAVESERAVLIGRIDDATLGADTLVEGDGESRNAFDLDFVEERIAEGIRRANRLDRDMACFRLLKTSLLHRFPDLEPNQVG
jgi:hypothetical protein